jgi:hypothetical protein
LRKHLITGLAKYKTGIARQRYFSSLSSKARGTGEDFVVHVTLASGDLIKEAEINGVCGMCSREQKYVWGLVGKSEGKSQLGLGLTYLLIYLLHAAESFLRS